MDNKILQPLDQRKILQIQARCAAMGGVPVGVVVDSPAGDGMLETYMVTWGRENSFGTSYPEYIVHQAIFKEDGACFFAHGDYMIPTLTEALQRMMERGHYAPTR